MVVNTLDKKNMGRIRGERLRALREVLGISRKEFANKHGIAPTTLQGWEEGRNNGITSKGVELVVRAYNSENVTCTKEWLLNGTGDTPLPPSLSWRLMDVSGLSEDEAIRKELLLFHQLIADPIDIIMSDNSMFPIYKKGDLLAGQRYFRDFDKVIGCECIIQTLQDGIFVRRLEPGSTSNTFNLIPLMEGAKTFKNIRVFSVAPILWVRRKSQNQ